jgi:hypothetical protein
MSCITILTIVMSWWLKFNWIITSSYTTKQKISTQKITHYSNYWVTNTKWISHARNDICSTPSYKEQEWHSTPSHKEQEWHSTSSHKEQEWHSTPSHKEQEWCSTPSYKEHEWHSTPSHKEQEWHHTKSYKVWEDITQKPTIPEMSSQKIKKTLMRPHEIMQNTNSRNKNT